MEEREVGGEGEVAIGIKGHNVPMHHLLPVLRTTLTVNGGLVLTRVGLVHIVDIL
jgi:hypothetical protein